MHTEETIKTKDGVYRLRIEYRDKKTSSAVLKGNTILFSISSRIPGELQEKVIENLKRRIIKRLEDPSRPKPRKRRKRVKTYSDGDVVEVDGVKFKLRIDYKDKRSSSAELVGKTIHMSVSNQLSERERKKHVQELFRLAISRHRLPKLKRLISKLNKKHFNVPFKDIKFRKQTTRWGSCSKNGNINISYRLLFAPQDVLEYVCVHELAHLIEFNHSKKFRDLVEKAMPDYKEKKRWLNKHGHKL